MVVRATKHSIYIYIRVVRTAVEHTFYSMVIRKHLDLENKRSRLTALSGKVLEFDDYGIHPCDVHGHIHE